MRDLLNSLGYDVLSDYNAQRVNEWLAWYKGYVKEFHDYTVYNGRKSLSQKRASLRMAKKVCEDWANLLMNEKVAFTAGNEAQTNRIKEIFEDNKFRVRANQLVELAFALGTGAFVEFKDGDSVNIDYVTADKIFPLSAENGQITECAFCSIKHIGGKKYYYLNIHVKNDGGNGYKIINKLFDANKKPCPLPDGVDEEIETGYDKPFFQIIKPNITSNLDIDGIMGMSVFANCLDVFRAIDVVFDSYRNEFILGKKRVVVSASVRENMEDENGVIRPIFDANDLVFYAIPESGDDKRVIQDINMELRTQAHDSAMRQNLNLLSEKCGFGPGHFDFEKSGGLKTATEIISDKSDLFQNLKKHELVLNDAFTDLIRAVMFLDSGVCDFPIEIDFDDSIIEDRKSEFAERAQLVTSGVMTKSEMRQWYLGETKEQADAAIAVMTEDYVPEEG